MELIEDETGVIVPSRQDVLEAIQEKRRGGWTSDSVPGHNGDLEGERALEEIERAAISKFLQSEQALDHMATAIAKQKFLARGISMERITSEDALFCKVKAEAILGTLSEAIG